MLILTGQIPENYLLTRTLSSETSLFDNTVGILTCMHGNGHRGVPERTKAQVNGSAGVKAEPQVSDPGLAGVCLKSQHEQPVPAKWARTPLISVTSPEWFGSSLVPLLGAASCRAFSSRRELSALPVLCCAVWGAGRM